MKLSQAKASLEVIPHSMDFQMLLNLKELIMQLRKNC